MTQEDKVTILVVEDNPLIYEPLTKNLALEGYKVELAIDGAECLDTIKDVNPDLVLLDVLLPKLDGWDVLTRLRDEPETAEVPVIMLTALDDDQSKIQGLRAGADDYVTKPFNTLELIARVEAVLKRVEKPATAGEPRDQIPARKGDKIYLVSVEDINFVDVHRDYTYINTDTERLLTNFTLGEMETMLDPGRFFRAHRGYIVNLQKVKEISRAGASTFELTIDDPARTRIPMSRRQSSALKKMLNF